MARPQATLWLCPDAVFDSGRLHAGRAVALTDGHLGPPCDPSEIPPEAQRIPLTGVLSPGYLDLQVNGGGGAFVNLARSVSDILAVRDAHLRLGTAAILPTVITDAPEVLERVVGLMLDLWPADGLLGLHIEGPHIAASRRGTHSLAHIRPLDGRTDDQVRRLRDAGIPVKITLAPEAVQPGQVAALVAMGAVVSLGHSDATAEMTRAALAEGASCFTHLFNAMPPIMNRQPGIAGAAINSHAYAGLICDGHHVADEVLSMAIRARPLKDRMFLVSDAMPTVGGPDHFDLYGQVIRLDGGRLVNAEGSLAGAHVTMAESVARAVRELDLPLEEALRMSIFVPAEVIGAKRWTQIAGYRADHALVVSVDGSRSTRLVDKLG